MKDGGLPHSDLNLLVLAVGGNVSQGILKALSRSSLRCKVIGADIGPRKMGLYTVDKALISPWAREPGFIEWLLAACREHEVNAVLTGAEPILPVLAENAERIKTETGAVCIVSNPAVLEVGDDKLLTSQWLARHGFCSPAFSASEDPESLGELGKAYGFPLIAKPRRGGGCRGHVRIENKDDLNYVARKPGYIVQRVVGNDDEEFTAGCFVDKAGEVRGVIVMRRELHEGTTVCAEIGAFPEVADAAAAITRTLKPAGPCNLQFRMLDGRPCCFEINVRFSGTTPVRAYFGFNEVEAALRHYVLDEPAQDLPRLTSGLMLRYWNELYVEPHVLQEFSPGACVESPTRFNLGINTFGDIGKNRE